MQPSAPAPDLGEQLYKTFGLTQDVAAEVVRGAARFVEMDRPDLFLHYLTFLKPGEQMLAVSSAVIVLLRAHGHSIDEAAAAAARMTAAFAAGYGCDLLSIPPDPDKQPMPTLAEVQRNLVDPRGN